MIKDVTTIAVDLAKDVFQVAYGDGQGRVYLGNALPFVVRLRYSLDSGAMSLL